MSYFDFCREIWKLSLLWKFSVTSWFRTPMHNAAVGGVPNSWHLTGLAVDVILDAEDETPQFIMACENRGLVAIDEKSHIHVQVRREVKNNGSA